MVERCLAKAEVAGSSPVSRSIWHHSQAVRQRSAKPLFPSSILGGASKAPRTQAFGASYILKPCGGNSGYKKSRISPAIRVSKSPGVVKGRLPLKLYSGSDDMCVRTDETPEVFVLCYFCRPGANARGKTRKTQKSGVQPPFRHSESPISRALIMILPYSFVKVPLMPMPALSFMVRLSPSTEKVYTFASSQSSSFTVIWSPSMV